METSSPLPPGFTWPRLAELVRALQAGTASAAQDYQPSKGDTAWSLGCLAYDRRKFHIARLAERREWLTILANNPEFIFAVDGYPVKHFKGEPDEPPLRAFVRRPRELDALQTILPLEGAVALQPLLRLIVTTDSKHLLSGAYLFKLHENGTIYDRWRLPVDAEAPLAYDATPEAYDPGPLDLSRRADESDVQEPGSDSGSERASAGR